MKTAAFCSLLAAVAAQTHYANPYLDAGCLGDELNMTVRGINGLFCSPKCDQNGGCPQDKPAGTAKGECQISFHPTTEDNNYCALMCYTFNQGMCDMAGGAHCYSATGGVEGVCTYGDYPGVSNSEQGEWHPRAIRDTQGDDLEHHQKEIFIGMFKGLLADTDDIEACEMDGMSAGLMLAAFVADLKEGKVLDALSDLAAGLGKLQPTLSECQKIQAEVQKLLGALEVIRPAQAEANLLAHKIDILEALVAAAKAREAKEYSDMGFDIGKVLRKVLEEDGLMV